MKVALNSMPGARRLGARGHHHSVGETKIRDGRLVDETWLGFACGAVEALLAEIRLRAMAKAAAE